MEKSVDFFSGIDLMIKYVSYGEMFEKIEDFEKIYERIFYHNVYPESYKYNKDKDYVWVARMYFITRKALGLSVEVKNDANYRYSLPIDISDLDLTEI